MTVLGNAPITTTFAALSQSSAGVDLLTGSATTGTDVSLYRWASVQLTAVGTGGLATFQVSDDNTNWTSIAFENVASPQAAALLTVGAAGMWHGPLPARYFRVLVTGISAGAMTGSVFMSSAPLAFATESVLASLQAVTSGGLSIKRLLSAATNNAQNVKASAGQLYGWEIANTNAAARYVKLYNETTTPAPATDVAALVIQVPASGKAVASHDTGIAFSVGIGLATVTGIAEADNTAVGAGDLEVNLFYK